MSLNKRYCSYISKSGSNVEVKITIHAMRRMEQRWRLIHGVDLGDSEAIEKKIQDMMRLSKRIVKKCQNLKSRSKRYGKDTMYFKYDEFVMVVQNKVMMTIEIRDSCNSHLNRQKLKR